MLKLSQRVFFWLVIIHIIWYDIIAIYPPPPHTHQAVTKAYIHAEVAYHARCLSEFSRIAPIPDEIDVDEEAEVGGGGIIIPCTVKVYIVSFAQ